MASQWLGLRLLGLGLLLTVLALTGERACVCSALSGFRCCQALFCFILDVVLVLMRPWLRQRCKLVALVRGCVEKLEGQFLSCSQILKSMY